MRYYEKIREIREDRGYTQQQIADILCVGQRTYSDYESGKTRIPLESAMLLARFYNVSLDYLVGITECAYPYPKTK
ncbi:helix-turn-helix transcriptional regulator [Agathobaculum sp. NSJ-28]|uniref:Helix-turn-helix transcriptional regulator n=3 Tax=Agathobaculum TaxID=2048137 RepID=A0A923LW33_9FIRM|nr:helix-turn-helix transcriptional regulator [Agathobaculum faecis]MBC5726443.1 helix-turn-helix transcriptional regulator [Agathobaculum faecis]MCU6790303.1 helix-turn-helix domain-containing protein [Agathobaculum ammoniilyticum]SCJ57697.1 HTH-type transcriptional regulator immR [uncultured Butyricicoccus sp.]